MLYSSVTGVTRKDNQADFLNAYYSSFASVMAAASKPMPFTLSELKKEILEKVKFGMYVGVNIIPVLLMPSEESFDLEDMPTDEAEMNKLMEEFAEKTRKVMATNPNFAPRFLSIFDEMKELGVMSSNNVNKLIRNYNSMKIKN